MALSKKKIPPKPSPKPPTRRYEGGPKAGRKATAAAVGKAKKVFAAKTKATAKAAQAGSVAGYGAIERRNATLPKYKPPAPKPRPTATPAQRGPIDQMMDWMGGQIDQMTGKKPSAISRAMHNPTPVIPYTQENVRKIKNARP